MSPSTDLSTQRVCAECLVSPALGVKIAQGRGRLVAASGLTLVGGRDKRAPAGLRPRVSAGFGFRPCKRSGLGGRTRLPGPGRVCEDAHCPLALSP